MAKMTDQIQDALRSIQSYASDPYKRVASSILSDSGQKEYERNPHFAALVEWLARYRRLTTKQMDLLQEALSRAKRGSKSRQRNTELLALCTLLLACDEDVLDAATEDLVTAVRTALILGKRIKHEAQEKIRDLAQRLEKQGKLPDRSSTARTAEEILAFERLQERIEAERSKPRKQKKIPVDLPSAPLPSPKASPKALPKAKTASPQEKQEAEREFQKEEKLLGSELTQEIEKEAREAQGPPVAPEAPEGSALAAARDVFNFEDDDEEIDL